jgi:hypothetical protein
MFNNLGDKSNLDLIGSATQSALTPYTPPATATQPGIGQPAANSLMSSLGIGTLNATPTQIGTQASNALLTQPTTITTPLTTATSALPATPTQAPLSTTPSTVPAQAQAPAINGLPTTPLGQLQAAVTTATPATGQTQTPFSGLPVSPGITAAFNRQRTFQ